MVRPVHHVGATVDVPVVHPEKVGTSLIMSSIDVDAVAMNHGSWVGTVDGLHDGITYPRLAGCFVQLQRPALALCQAGGVTLEITGSGGVALQLPVEPGPCGDGELSAVRLTVGAAVTYRKVGSVCGHVLNAVEVVHAVLVGDVFLAAEDVDDGRVNLLQLVLLRHGHVGHGTAGVLLLEESAVANHQRGDTFVGTVEECLQTAARHAREADFLHIYLIIIR